MGTRRAGCGCCHPSRLSNVSHGANSKSLSLHRHRDCMYCTVQYILTACASARGGGEERRGKACAGTGTHGGGPCCRYRACRTRHGTRRSIDTQRDVWRTSCICGPLGKDRTRRNFHSEATSQYAACMNGCGAVEACSKRERRHAGRHAGHARPAEGSQPVKSGE